MKRTEYLQRAREFCPRGESHGGAKLTEQTVKAIRANPEKLTARQLASQFGVSKRTIESVRQYQSWGHV